MIQFDRPSLSGLRDTITRLADEAAARVAAAPTPLELAIDGLRQSLESKIDSYRRAVVGISGVFETDQAQSISLLLASSVVEHSQLTTTIARVTRSDIVANPTAANTCVDGMRPLRPRSVNIWPSARVEEGVFYSVDQLELLHWLRAESEFSIVAFDTLGDVITHEALARRLDGIVIVNAGGSFDRELMTSTTRILQRKGIRILGQIKNHKATADAEEPATGDRLKGT